MNNDTTQKPITGYIVQIKDRFFVEGGIGNYRHTQFMKQAKVFPIESKTAAEYVATGLKGKVVPITYKWR